LSEDIAFPKKWSELSQDEQREWIRAYYMPKTRIPEPVLSRRLNIKEGTLKLDNGTKMKFPIKPVVISKSNPSIVREFEFWIGKWLFTVFHDKTMSHVKYIGVSNPSASKWIAQEFTIEVWRKLCAITTTLGHKYRMFQRKRADSKRKNGDFSLSLRDNRGEKDVG
jgi:hypothetical protein